MSPPRAVRFGPPIAVQIIALLVAALVIGQLVTLAVVVVLPPPHPPIYRLEEVAAALKGDHVTPRYGPALARTTVTTPFAEPPSETRRAEGLRAQLTRLLGVPETQVRLLIEPRPPIWFLSTPWNRRPHRDQQIIEDGPPPPGPPPADRAPPDEGPGSAPMARSDDSAPFWLRHGRRSGWFGGHMGGAGGGFVVGEMEAAYQPEQLPGGRGAWVIVSSPRPGFPNAWQRRVLLWFLAALAVLTPIGYLFARRLTAPIVRFSEAADRLGRGLRTAPLTLKGPAEIGVAAAAFNQMQARLARYVEDRTAMIGAIAHDLRTPLARVQFKLQRAPASLAADIRTDLGQMEAMIAAVLAFVRDAAPAHERDPLDLLSLLEVVVDDAKATGADVQMQPGEIVIVDGDVTGLQRLFVNLVDNAVKYGGEARLALRSDGDEAVVDIVDAGPGLSEDERERVFEPFYRLETSRSRDTGGIGLGLSIARSIARAHGGEVSLVSGDPGLKAVVRLPVAKGRS